MSFNISELLNPAPSSAGQNPPSPPVQPPEAAGTSQTVARSASVGMRAPATTAYEAADALTALATSGAPTFNHSYASSGSSFPTSHAQQQPATTYSEARRQSSFGSVAMPVEPSPPLERTQQPFSPTLDQYHHGSKSPEEQRRQSLAARSSPPPRLAPIQSLGRTLSGQIGEEGLQTAYGHDASQLIGSAPTARMTAGSTAEANNIAQNREPDYVRDNPATAQIRQALPARQIVDLPSTLFEHTNGHGVLSSPPPQIKREPHEHTPSHAADGSLDAQTLKAVAELKNEYGLRGQNRETVSPAMEKEKSAPASKKRPAPKTAGATKKGTAKRPPAKKRKIEDEKASASGSPASAQRSGTPSSRVSKAHTGAAKRNSKSQSNTPALASSPAADVLDGGDPEAGTPEESGSDIDDNNVYCICRKPDDHTWMIYCDGGCKDWFHGKCVNMRKEDSDLVDKYICPNCEAKGRGNTTWKRMCRRLGCRKPARAQGQGSKYCTDECGWLFFKEMIEKGQRSSEAGSGVAAKPKPRRKASRIDTGAEDDEDMDHGPRGGILRTKELKALATSVKDHDEFRALGSGVLSPPASVSPEATTFPKPDRDTNGSDLSLISQPYSLNHPETARVTAIAAEKDALRARRALLKDRERFVALTREQASRYAEREGVKKDFCGFDPRLAWSDAEFARWRNGRVGRAALRLGTLETGDVVDGEVDGVDGEVDGEGGGEGEGEGNGASGAPTTNGDAPDAAGDAAEPAICLRKRCERHKNWPKLALADVRFEEADVADRMRGLEREEREVRERAMLRWRGEMSAAKRAGDGMGEGWVEVVEG